MAAVPGSGAASIGMGETPRARTEPQVSTAIDIFIRSRYFKAVRLYRENNFSPMHITPASYQIAASPCAGGFAAIAPIPRRGFLRSGSVGCRVALPDNQDIAQKAMLQKINDDEMRASAVNTIIIPFFETMTCLGCCFSVFPTGLKFVRGQEDDPSSPAPQDQEQVVRTR